MTGSVKIIFLRSRNLIWNDIEVKNFNFLSNVVLYYSNAVRMKEVIESGREAKTRWKSVHERTSGEKISLFFEKSTSRVREKKITGFEFYSSAKDWEEKLLIVKHVKRNFFLRTNSSIYFVFEEWFSFRVRKIQCNSESTFKRVYKLRSNGKSHSHRNCRMNKSWKIC